MCTEGREHLYLERPLRQYLLWLVLSQKVSKENIYFVRIEVSIFFRRYHESRNSQRSSRNRLRCNASCWSESLIIRYPFSYSKIFYNPARHFGSRISTFSCSIFSIRHLRIRLSLRLSCWQCNGRGFNRIYKVRIIRVLEPFVFYFYFHQPV